MNRVNPTFVRDGRPLRDWLPELVSDHLPTKRRAQNAVSAMHWGVERADQDALFLLAGIDLPAHERAFADAVADALDDPGFDAAAFVRAALAERRAGMRRIERSLELQDRLFDDEMEPGSPEAERLGREIATLDSREGLLPNSHGDYALQLVIESAGRVLLRMPPEEVRDLLRDPDCHQIVTKALGRVGPAAAAFAMPMMIPVGSDSVGDAVALAAVGRSDRAVIRMLVDRLHHPQHNIAWQAAETLMHMGPAVLDLEPGLVDELLSMLDASGEPHLGVLRALAAIAPGRRDVFERIAAIARPGPPVMRTETHETFTHEYDARMGWRGVAIEALGRFTAYAADAAAVITESIDNFEEYDPDLTYEGDYERITGALWDLGDAAAVAVPALCGRLRRKGDDDSVDWDRVRFFAHLGPTAKAALPALRELQQDLGEIDDNTRGDKTLDPLGHAIARIEGATPP